MVLSIENLPLQIARLTEEMMSIKRLLQELGSSQTINQKEVIGIEEVCKMTGYAKNTVYQYVHKKAIPFHKADHGGRKLIFFRSEIENWLKGRNEETVEEYCERKENELYNSMKGGVN